MSTGQDDKTTNGLNPEKLFGIILLCPPLLSSFLFIGNLFSRNIGKIARLSNLSGHWTGEYDYAAESGGAGYTSAAPIYLGLMAIAGALLVKGSKK